MAQAWQFARRHRLTRGSCAKPRLPHLDPHLTHLHIRMLLDARTPSVEQAAWGFLGIRQYSMRGKRALALDAVRSTNPPPRPPFSALHEALEPLRRLGELRGELLDPLEQYLVGDVLEDDR